MSKDETPLTLGKLGILLGAVAAVWSISGLALYFVKDRGTFGDMFGAVNALFSGLAFASIVYTILLQRQELVLQRRELELTRGELQGQKLQLQAQNEVMRSQNFEATFFQLLRLLSETVAAIDLNKIGGEQVASGRDCFITFYRRLKRHYESSEKAIGPQDESEIIRIAYAKFYKDNQSDVGHYFRTLYNAVKFVHLSPVANKRLYSNLIRAQLSVQELLLLHYNCLTDLGLDKFKPLIEEYALLKALPVELLIKSVHADLYHPSAFGRSAKHTD